MSCCKMGVNSNVPHVDSFFGTTYNLRPYVGNSVYWLLQSDFFPSQMSILFTFFQSLCSHNKVQTLLTAVHFFRLFNRPKLSSPLFVIRHTLLGTPSSSNPLFPFQTIVAALQSSYIVQQISVIALQCQFNGFILASVVWTSDIQGQGQGLSNVLVSCRTVSFVVVVVFQLFCHVRLFNPMDLCGRHSRLPLSFTS